MELEKELLKRKILVWVRSLVVIFADDIARFACHVTAHPARSVRASPFC
ncbi:hypothetical protein ACVXHB_18145 [Escherichia coli]